MQIDKNLTEEMNKLLVKGNIDKVLQLLNERINNDADNPDYLGLRAMVYSTQTKYNLALKDIKKAIEQNPQDSEFYTISGEIYFRQEEYNLALKDFLKAKELKSENSDTYHYLGLIYMDQYEYALAIENFDKAISLDSKNKLSSFFKDECYVKMKKNEHLQQKTLETEQITKGFPYLDRGMFYVENNKIDLAIKDFIKYIQVEPKKAIGYFWLAVTHHKQNKNISALSYFNKSIKLSETTKYYLDVIYHGRGKFFTDIKQYNAAINDFTKAINLNNNNEDFYISRANTYMIIKNYVAAIKDFDKAIEINKDNDHSFYRRGLANFELDDYDKAIKDFSKAIELNPCYSDYLIWRAKCYFEQEKYDLALKDIEKASEDNISTVSCFWKGMIYREKAEYESAIQEFSQAIILDPYVEEIYVERGYTYLNMNRGNLAIEDFEKAISLNPQTEVLDLYKKILIDIQHISFDN